MAADNRLLTFISFFKEKKKNQFYHTNKIHDIANVEAASHCQGVIESLVIVNKHKSAFACL